MHSGLFFLKKTGISVSCAVVKNCIAVLEESSDTLWKSSFENNFVVVPFAVLCLELRTNQSCRLKIYTVCGCILDVFRAYI